MRNPNRATKRRSNIHILASLMPQAEQFLGKFVFKFGRVYKLHRSKWCRHVLFLLEYTEREDQIAFIKSILTEADTRPISLGRRTTP